MDPGKSWEKAQVLENPVKSWNSEAVVLENLISGSSNR